MNYAETLRGSMSISKLLEKFIQKKLLRLKIFYQDIKKFIWK